MEFNSRGGGGPVRKDQSQKKKSKKKHPEGRSCLGRGSKFPHGEPRSSYVLNLGLRLQTHGEACMWVRGQKEGGSVWRTSSLVCGGHQVLRSHSALHWYFFLCRRIRIKLIKSVVSKNPAVFFVWRELRNLKNVT